MFRNVLNVHERAFAALARDVGGLIDGLASAGDRLWPCGRWPAMKLDRPLAVGARGGHGPIRYTVIEYARGERVRFRFDAPRGFDGTHEFRVVAGRDGRVVLRHEIAMTLSGRARLAWPLVFRPLHDALLEDALDDAARALGERPVDAPWSARVRLLRAALARRRSVARD